MKKHLLVCLLALVLASLCMLPSQVQAAETETHDDHCLCGADHVSIDGHTTDSSRPWTPWTPVSNGQVQWPTAGNVYYYLTDDVEINETWKVVSNNATSIYICLNGHSITMTGSAPAIEVDGTTNGNRASLIITDCKGTGKIIHKEGAKGPAVKVCGFGSFTMYGGTITGNHVNGNGGGVYIDGGSSKFTMYGGSITDNSATGSGGGVYVVSSLGVFVDVGGNAQIVGNKADTNENSGICIYSSSSTSSSSSYKTKLTVKKLITDARIVIDNKAPANYITDSSKGNYDIDTNGVLTAPSHKPHYLCGSSDHKEGCTSDTCKKATSPVDFKEWTSDNSLPTSTGNYYLTKNVKLSAGHTFTGNVTLCLNGYKIEAAPDAIDNIWVNGTLTITDCVGSGSIVGADKKHTGVNIQSNTGTLNLYGGTIKNFAKGVVNNGTFNMYGGKLTKNSQGVSNQRTFNMHGGTITENSGADNGAGVSNSDSFTMSGGDITNNTTSQGSGKGYGGGVYNSQYFEMTGGTITGNEAKQCGGGVYNNNHFEMTGGTIEQNTAKNYGGGGGVYSGSNSTYIYGGRITNNNAYSFGGDVYAASGKGVHLKGNVTIGNDRSYGLLTDTEHYIDGALDKGSAIRLFVPGGKKNGDVLLSPFGNYKITEADLEKISFTNTSAGYEAILKNGDVILSLPHKHTLCNKTSRLHTGAGHSGSCGENITFSEWTDAAAQAQYDSAATAASCLPNEGSWYLKQNVNLTATHEVDGKTLNLCLNGNSVTLNADGAVFSVKSGGVLNLTDCKGTGSITHADSKNGTGVSVGTGGDGTTAGTFNLYNGKITGNNNSDNGGGVSVLSDGQFNMYGGAITENKAATGGGVNVADHATVTIGGGSITNNEAADGGGMTVGNCQVTLSGKVTITGNKSTDGTGSNLYIDKNKGGKIVVLNDSLDSNSRVVFKDCDNQYDGTYYISNADTLDNTKLTCFTTDAGRKFVKAGDENKVYVATVLDITQKPTVQNLVYNGTEQTGVIATADAGKCYTITGTTATQANAAYAEGNENRNGYKAVVTLNPGYALYHKNTYYVADTPLNLVWRIAAKPAAADDFEVDASTPLTTTFGDSSYKGITVTVAAKYTEHHENWNDKLEVQYKAEGGDWLSTAPTDAGTYNLRVHIANDGNFAAGYVPLTDVLTIKPASQPKPDRNKLTVTAPTSINGEDGQITGVTTAMQYSTDNGQSWTDCTGNTISGSSGKYQIRVKAKPNHDASPVVEVIVPPHVHDFCMEKVAQEYSAAPATCTAAATYYKSCACGISSKDMAKPATFTVGNPLGHDYKWEPLDDGTHHAKHCTKGCNTWKMETEAAHSYDGLEGTECRDCGYVRFVGHYTVTIAVEGNGFGTVSDNVVKNVPEGATITVNGGELTIHGTTDTKVTATASANTPQYTYTFTGWTIGGQPISENYTINKPVTITASFNRVVNQYTVTWNADGGIIQDTGYTSGAQNWGTPINAPSKVVKAPDSSCSYTFAGWQDDAGNAPAATVTGDVTYTAQYTKKAHEYKADVWAHDDSGHWHVCTVSGCGYATEKTSHTYADADATVCTVCGASRTLPVLTGKVEIIGELAKGERLTVVATDLPSTATLRYQWLRNDAIITGANGMDYTLTAEDVGAKISVNVTAVGHTGSLYAIAAGQVDVIYTVSYDTNGGTIGSLRQDRVKFGTDYTLPECDFITAPDKMTFDLWEIDGVSYKAGTAYRVMNDVTVVALWKDADSDRPAPTPSRPSHKGSTIEAISTADGRSATDYSGGIYGLTFRSTAGFSSFLGVQVDGRTIAPSCYSAEEGSIVVYLKAAYLRTLKAGTHTITILSSEGNASMEFTVGGVTTSPKTFDAGVAGYVSIALLGLTGSSLCLRRKEDENA